MPHIYEEMDPTYAAACSDITLCSSSKGFFKSFAEDLVAMASAEWLQKFENIEEGKKVKAVLENKEVCVKVKEYLY